MDSAMCGDPFGKGWLPNGPCGRISSAIAWAFMKSTTSGDSKIRCNTVVELKASYSGTPLISNQTRLIPTFSRSVPAPFSYSDHPARILGLRFLFVIPYSEICKS